MSTGWSLVPFSEFLTSNQRPYTLGPTEDANLVGMRWYGFGPFHRELKLAAKIQKKSHYVIRTGDVIYNKLFAWKGAFGVVTDELNNMFVSDKFPTYELNDKKVDHNYLKWYFRCPSLWEKAQRLSIGSAAISKLTLNPPKFRDLTIPLPPLTEQRQIVAKIERLAAKIDVVQELHGLVLQEIEAFFKASLGKLTNFSELGILGTVLYGKPRNGWSARCDNADNGTPILALGAVTGYQYGPTAFKRTSLPTDQNAHYWLNPGDLLITRSNTPKLVGHAAIYNGVPERCIYPDLMMRLPVNEEVADKKFIWFWLQSQPVREFIGANAKGTSPTMKKISQGTVMRIPFPEKTTLEEQQRIVIHLESLQTRVNHLQELQKHTAAELDALLPSILDKAFKGEL